MSGKLASSPRRVLRAAALVTITGGVLALTGCSSQWARFGMPAPASEEAHHILQLWVGAWIASLVVGGLVWGLIGWAVIRYRRKQGDPPIPRQTTYHLPLELLYTLVPFLIIGVLFFYTVRAQDAVLEQNREPDVVINVVGQKWSWTFNYLEQDNPKVGTAAYEYGTLETIPDLYLPVNKRVRFNLESADVIHSFWIPNFLFKRDVIPGHSNSFDVTPTQLGTYDGKCAELCGQYHALMLFKVHVVTQEEYEAHVRELAANGQAGERNLQKAVQATLPSPTAQSEEHK